MPATPMAVARWLLPLPGPPTRTTLCAPSVKAVSASCTTSFLSTGETSKSKPARSRCTGNFATLIWWLTERVARSVVSARSICSISQREPSSSPWFCSIRSVHVAAMPYRRNALSSAMTSRIMVGLLDVAQPVVAGGVDDRRRQNLQQRRDVGRPRRRVQPCQHVDDVLLPDPPRRRRTLQRELHRHQHGVEPGVRNQCQNLGDRKSTRLKS